MNILKLSFFATLCLAVISIQSQYEPTQGTLTLGDTRELCSVTKKSSIKRGAIMNTIITDQDFQNEFLTIKQFLNIPQNQTDIDITYQELIDRLTKSTNKKYTVAVIKALEKAIMHQYHYEAYMVGSYHHYASLLFTGIQYPTIWFDKDSPVFKQVLQELTVLQNIAKPHSLATYYRIKAMINSYKNWKQSFAAGIIVACIALPIAYHSWCQK